jgi:hypothetical protein
MKKKDGLKVCVCMWGAVGYSHEKQKTDGRLFAAELILISPESSECVPRM